MKKFVIFIFCLFMISGCGNDNSNKTTDEHISYIEAKEKIINEGAILVDVRSEEEYNDGHIDGAILIQLDDISDERLSEVVSTKDIPIIVYCKSGNRSYQAVEKLTELGYTNVYDLGAMSNWKE